MAEALDPDSIAKLLSDHKRALEEEFELADKADPASLTVIRKNAATELLQAVPEAVRRVVHLMEHGDKDSTQLAAARFIIQNGLLDGLAGEGADPLQNLINQLTKVEAS